MHQLEQVALGADVALLQSVLEVGEDAIEGVELRTGWWQEDALGLELGQHCVDWLFVVLALRIEVDAVHISDEIRLFRAFEVASVISHSLHCLERVDNALAELSSGVEAMLDTVVEHSFNGSSRDNRDVILFSVLKLVESVGHVLLLHEGGDGERELVDVHHDVIVVDERQQDGGVDAAILFVLGLVLLDRTDLEVLVGVPHFPEVPGDDGPGELLLCLAVDVLGKLHCCVEGLLLQGLLDGALNVDGLAVLALLLQRGDQGTASHYLCRAELAVLVEDGGIAQSELASDLLEVVPWVLALLLLLGVICEDFVHEH